MASNALSYKKIKEFAEFLDDNFWEVRKTNPEIVMDRFNRQEAEKKADEKAEAEILKK